MIVGLALAQMVGASVALALIFGAIWVRTQSLLVVTVLHWGYNVFRDAITLTTGHSMIALPMRAAVIVAGVVLAVRFLKNQTRVDLPVKAT